MAPTIPPPRDRAVLEKRLGIRMIDFGDHYIIVDIGIGYRSNLGNTSQVTYQFSERMGYHTIFGPKNVHKNIGWGIRIRHILWHLVSSPTDWCCSEGWLNHRPADKRCVSTWLPGRYVIYWLLRSMPERCVAKEGWGHVGRLGRLVAGQCTKNRKPMNISLLLLLLLYIYICTYLIIYIYIWLSDMN